MNLVGGPPSTGSYDSPPISYFDEIDQRPLFSRSRRSILDSRNDPAYRFRMHGTLILSDSKIALVERRSDSEFILVREGDYLGTWQVISISPTSVSLRNPSRRHEIHLTLELEEELHAENDTAHADNRRDGSTYESSEQKRQHSIPRDPTADNGSLRYAPPIPSSSVPPPPPFRMPIAWN